MLAVEDHKIWSLAGVRGFKPLDYSGPRYLGWSDCVFHYVVAPIFLRRDGYP
jgi:hypothetical protein